MPAPIWLSECSAVVQRCGCWRRVASVCGSELRQPGASPPWQALIGARVSAPVELLAYPAVRLFVERAQAIESGFALGPSRCIQFVDICACLEGLPLAVELAAARVSALSLAQILERLDDSFRLLVGGSRTAPTRQQTLRATLDWSHALLPESEQAIFRRLAVFGGGWSLEAAEAVCADPLVQRADVLEFLSHLVDKSLVVVAVDERDGRSRYRLLEPIRQYARDQLVASGESNTIAERHAAFFLAFAESHERDASVGGVAAGTGADALEAEYRNLQAATTRAIDTHDAELGLAPGLDTPVRMEVPPASGGGPPVARGDPRAAGG